MSYFASALSQHPNTADAAAEIVGHLLEQQQEPPDLAVFFGSPHHADAFDELTRAIRSLLHPRHLLGVTASGIVSGTREIEDGPALSLWTGRLGVEPEPVRLSAARTEAGTAIQGLPPATADRPMSLLLLSDPFTMPVPDLLDVLAAREDDLPVIGGLASGSVAPRGNRLVLDDEVYRDGAVGVLLPSTVVQPLVSQGCRPIGTPMIVTRAAEGGIAELAGQPALERLQQVAGQVEAEDRALLAQGVHIGVVVDEHRSDFGRGDFLVRNVAAADRASGAITVGTQLEVGTTIQFHVRDASSADEDLRTLLAARDATGGALLFTCNGRGQNLFDEPDHDAELVAGITQDDAVAGMFCAGEIGPVGSRSFLHSFTASVALFDPAPAGQA